ncbi:ATP-dependent DNA helicase PIF2-like [Chenopodium quinoa]|uniref:ATP-dependent DNA helicase PIF2-like n=1 Tax=Chenopodium quinoa TaxID=63459 RepID=UPI000B7923E2|nr:ATP-dependent DNA helicase PIF2-like [Chenopodium quinoa]
MRQLFTTLLIFCKPSNPCALWDRFYTSLSEDFNYKYPNCKSKVMSLTIREVENNLEAMGKSLENFGLGHLIEETDARIHITKDIADALEAPIPPECLECRSKLNAAQTNAFNSILSHIQDGKPGCFFVDGPGGTGKTFLYNALYVEVLFSGKIVLPTATSGISASNIPSGRTTHSRFKIPLNSDISLACDVPKQGSLAALIKDAALIIWDEASMARRENIESLDLLLRDLCNPEVPFGGKVVVFGGDFRQVLPILPRRTQKEAVGVSVVSSHIWPLLIKFRLTENIRAKEDPVHSSFLLSLGNGQLQSIENSYVQVPHHIISYYAPNEDAVSILAATIFPEIKVQGFDSSIFNERAIITSMNEDVDIINEHMIGMFPSISTIYLSYDSVLDDSCTLYPTEF